MLAKPKTDTKQVDSKGRITLDRRFANRVVMIEDVDDTEVRITMARVIPEREAWLYDHPEAKKAVFAGIEQARSMQLVEAAPDLAADKDLADGIGDE